MYCNLCVVDFLPIRKKLTGEELVRISCDYFNVPIQDIQSKCRLDVWVKPRHMILCYLSSEKKLTLQECGNLVNRVSHASAYYATRSVRNQCFVDRQYKKEYNDYVNYMESFFK